MAISPEGMTKKPTLLMTDGTKMHSSDIRINGRMAILSPLT